MELLETLTIGAKQLNVDINPQAAELFMRYKKLLLEWNQKMNLTALINDYDIVVKHFLDSISIIPLLPIGENYKIIDVGTGAGFPGIPIKILKPETNLTLLDSLNKRLVFLNEIIKNMKLQDTVTVHSRAEDASKNKIHRECYDVCVSRAVASLPLLAEYCMPFVKVFGIFIAMKGPGADDEIKDSQLIIKQLGGEIVEIKHLTLPYTEIIRKVIIIKKIRQTPAKFPRNSAQLAKIKNK